MATINGLFLSTIPEEYHLTELENNMIAQSIIFPYLYCLKKYRWAATKKQMISVPVAPETISKTLQQLPRLPSEAGLVEVGFKRKMEYNHSHKQELIDVNKIFKVLEFLRTSGNPYYQNFDNIATYTKRYTDANDQTFDQEDMEMDNADEIAIKEDEDDDPDDEIIKDTIKKHQFDHNRNTAMTNNFPEMTTDENGRKVSGQLFFAPAEGNCPVNLQEKKIGTSKVGQLSYLTENLGKILREKYD